MNVFLPPAPAPWAFLRIFPRSAPAPGGYPSPVCHNKPMLPSMGVATERPTRVRYWVIVFAVTLAVITYIDRVALSYASLVIRHDLALSPAQIDDRIDRVTKHMAIEIDATADQQAKIAAIAKAAVADLRPLREKAQATRAQAVTLLTAPTIDRSAIERLRAEQIGLAETASKRIAQALADTADVLSPEQRRKVADWMALWRPWWARWHRG